MKLCQLTLHAVLLLLVLGKAQAGSSQDSVLIHNAPVYFTANAGQWDTQVRFAALGTQSSAWLCDDGIVLVRSRKSLKFPEELGISTKPRADQEMVKLTFQNPSPRMRVVAADTTFARTQFYLGRDSANWHESVSNHRAVRYQNIWDGVDMEYTVGENGVLRQTFFIAPGTNLAQNCLKASGAGAGEIRIMLNEALAGAAVNSISNGGFKFKDTLALTMEYNTGLYFGQDHGCHAVTRNGELVLLGWTGDPALPLRNALQDTLYDRGAVFVMRFDSTGRDYRYCTYIRGDPPLVQNRLRSLAVDSEGDAYGVVGTQEGMPLLSNTYQGFPEYSPNVLDTTFAPYLLRLTPDGMLRGSTYLGGPGHFWVKHLVVSDRGVFVAGESNYAPLRTTPNALLGSNRDAAKHAVACARLTHGLDSLVFLSYVIAMTQAPHVAGGFTNYVSDINPDGDGNLLLAFNISESANDTVTIPGIGRGEYDGYLVAKLSADGKRMLFARHIDFPDISGDRWGGVFGGIFSVNIRADGQIDVFGNTVQDSPEPPSLPPGWIDDAVVSPPSGSGSDQLKWAMRMSAAGEFLYGVYYGRSQGFSAMSKLTRNNTCGGYLWTCPNMIRRDILRPVDPVSSVGDTLHEHFFLDIGDDLRVRTATGWDAAYIPKYFDSDGTLSTDAHGYSYLLGRTYWKENYRYFNSWKPLSTAELGFFYLTRFRFYTPCWQVGCEIVTPDTIHIERRRGYYAPDEFTVGYTVTNYSAAKSARIDHAVIELPPGLQLVSGMPSQQMSPPELAPGNSAYCSWRVRITDPGLLTDHGLSDTALIRCRVYYVDPESGQTWPMGEELCEKDIVVNVYDEPDPNLVCTVAGPDSLFWRGSGYSPFPGGNPGPVTYHVTLTNLEKDTIDITSFIMRAFEHCRIVGTPQFPGLRLAPGATHAFDVLVLVDPVLVPRTIRIETDALDIYNVPVSSCAAETRVPGVRDLPCAVTGPARIRWYPKSGQAYPGLLTLTLHLDSPLDTVRAGVCTWIDTSSAPHVSLAPGDSASRPPVDIAEGGTYEPYWRFVLARPPSSNASDTIRFTYEADGVQYACVYVITIDVILIEKSVICDLMGTDSLSIAQIQAREQAQLHYALTNTGTITVDVDRYELAIVPAAGFPEAGLISLDPLVRAGGSIDPGDDITMDWNLHALILRTSRTAECTVTAYDANDSVLAVCTHTIALEGLDGLICTMTATDSVHFNRAELRYEPEEITATFSLENLLDTEETNIEAVIDLTQSPRFMLDPSETASKAISVLDSHSTANLTWILIPQPATTAEDQEIIVRYRSDEQSEWKECSVIIHIEVWPEEMGIACATGGHDSLYADPYYERFIPNPLFVSYTVTNTGTIALTGCEASIVLPPEFILDGSDSTQLFTSPEFANQQGGPVPPGTLLPNASCTRWWMITPSTQLTAVGTVDIRWQWRSDQQGSGDGCSSSIEVVFDSPGSIVLSPKHLYFEAERGGPIPAAQNVLLWTGGGNSMPWSMQPSETWLNANPLSGSQEATVAVQPNSTMLDVGGHAAALNVSATPSNRSIAVTYVIRKSTGVGDPSLPTALTLEAWPQPVTIGGMLQVAIAGAGDESYRLSLYDMLGRERLSRTLEAGEQWRISVSGAQFTPGSYILRVTAADGAQVSRLISVIR
ncbi:T9SS type A sorting domain-containing protein [bacterium]|nr:T9SS type A sorting domain-containing protein [bacterium]